MADQRSVEARSLTRDELLVLDAMLDRLSQCKSLVDAVRTWLSFCVPAHAAGGRFDLEEERAGCPLAISEGALSAKSVSYPVSDDGFVFATATMSPAAESSNSAFTSALCERAARMIANIAAFERERNVSWAFQHAALSTALPNISGYRFNAVYQAGRSEAQVGGDWYDAFVTSDGRIVLSIGDVLGSGLNAAVAMLAVRQAIRGVAEVYANPVLMVRAADRIVRAQHPDRFVTTIVGVVDPATQMLTYVNAGHPPALLRDEDGEVRGLGATMPPIGVALDVKQEVDARTERLLPGTVLLLYTDGLTEHSKDVISGDCRLREAFKKVDPAHGAIAALLYNTILPGHARDDVAMLALAVGDQPSILRWRFDPAWPDVAARARQEIETQLRLHYQMSDEGMFAFRTIFAELAANVLRHAPGAATFVIQAAEDPVLHVLDSGEGFYFAPHLPYDLFAESGRGLFLIAQLAKRFSVEPRASKGSHARVTLQC